LDSRNFLRITQQRTRIEEKKKIEIELDKHFKIGVQYTDQKKKARERIYRK
jgi:ribulose bisphosphate carboxylase small subunit